MKTIIKHGSKPYKYKIQCPYCDCIFEYDRTDVYPTDHYVIGWGTVVSQLVECPECSEQLTHSESNV